MTNTVPIIVSTFDSYQACWPGWCHGYSKYWRDWPGEVYFLSNFVTAPCGTPVRTGQEYTWPAMMKAALHAISAEVVILSLEDYWITRAVDSNEIASYVRLIEQNVADHVRLYPTPYPDSAYPNDPRLGVIDEHAYFRVSVQIGIWRKEVLLGLIRDSESIWQFEVEGSSRSSSFFRNRFLSVVSTAFGVHYINAVNKGVWTNAAYRYAKLEKIELDWAALGHRTITSH